MGLAHFAPKDFLQLSRRGLALLFLVAAFALLSSNRSSAKSPFTQFDVPNASNTKPQGINNTNDMVGSATLDGTTQGFVRTSDGTFTTFFVTHKGTQQVTEATAINASDQIVGLYQYFLTGFGNVDGSYLRSVDGTITTFDPPKSFSYAIGINDSGWILGGYFQENMGYLRDPNGKFTKILVPGSDGTSVWGINNDNTIVGSYFIQTQGQGGFVRSKSGKYKTFEIPDLNQIQHMSINSKGVIAGSYQDTEFNNHGFIRTINGTITTFDVPQAVYTNPNSINDDGSIVGFSEDADDNDHGFLRTKSGKIRTFDFSKKKSDSQGTFPSAINNNGVLVGYIRIPGDNPVFHGFFGVP